MATNSFASTQNPATFRLKPDDPTINFISGSDDERSRILQYHPEVEGIISVYQGHLKIFYGVEQIMTFVKGKAHNTFIAVTANYSNHTPMEFGMISMFGINFFFASKKKLGEDWRISADCTTFMKEFLCVEGLHKGVKKIKDLVVVN